MSSMAATCSPTSPQLRFAVSSRNGRGSSAPAVLVRTRFAKPGRPVRLVSAVRTGEGAMKRRRGWSSWMMSDSNADNFAGWSDSSDGDQQAMVASQRKKWLGGMVAAGAAGVILIAGLTSAALSLSRRSSSRADQLMEPLTPKQEVLLAVDEEDDKLKENEGDEIEEKPDDGSVESETGTYIDVSYDADSENKLGDSDETSSADNVEYSTIGSDANDNNSVRESLQNDLAFDDKSVASVMISTPQNLPDSEIVDCSHAASLPESEPEMEQQSITVEPAGLLSTMILNSEHKEGLPDTRIQENPNPLLGSVNSTVQEPGQSVAVSISVSSSLDTILEPQTALGDDSKTVASPLTDENLDLGKTSQVLTVGNSSPLEVNSTDESVSSGTSTVSVSTSALAIEQDTIPNDVTNGSRSFYSLSTSENSFSSAGIPAPTAVSPALQVLPGKVLVPAVVDQVQAQTLAALQVLKVIEANVQPSDLCKRREYARWLVSASSALSRNTMSKVYPAMYIENVTELAFDDITPDDPDFSSIQGLAEAGLISSKLSRRDMLPSLDEDEGPFYFSPESPLSRQDLVSWKMALEKRQLPEADRKILYQLSGFRDIEKINPDAWPALIADLSDGDQGIISLAFGCIRLFQPDKPVTKAQAAVALANGEASDVVSEELARIEAESMAENAVSAHNALVAQVEKDINASFEEELLMEREKINAVEKMAEEARLELERLRAEREEDKIALMKERFAIEAEMEVLSKLRHDVEEELQSIMSNKVEISYKKERISKLQKEAEDEKQEISRLQYELEVERKALSMARAWAEDEAKRAREQAKALEEARDRWERHGIKVVVDSDLQEESSAGVSWLTTGKQFSVEGTVSRAETLADKLKLMADEVGGKSREIINKMMKKILYVISVLKEWAAKAAEQTKELKDTAILKVRGSIQELHQSTTEFSSDIKERATGSIQELQQGTAEFSFAVKEGIKRVAGDCRVGVEKLTQKFKS